MLSLHSPFSAAEAQNVAAIPVSDCQLRDTAMFAVAVPLHGFLTGLGGGSEFGINKHFCTISQCFSLGNSRWWEKPLPQPGLAEVEGKGSGSSIPFSSIPWDCSIRARQSPLLGV